MLENKRKHTRKPKTRAERSAERQALWKELDVWLQREKDMEVELALRRPEAAERMAFCRQEQAKLKEKILKLERGVSRQRAWNRGVKL